MLLRFPANDVNHCVWRDSRVILSNQKSVFTQLAKKKKNLKKPGQTHQRCNTGLNVGVTAERSYLRPWSRVPFVCVDWSNRHAIVLQIWKILSDAPENGISCLVHCLRRHRFRVDSERRTRNLESKTAFWLSFHFSRGQHWKSRSSSFRRLSLLRNHTEALAT